MFNLETMYVYIYVGLQNEMSEHEVQHIRVLALSFRFKCILML